MGLAVMAAVLVAAAAQVGVAAAAEEFWVDAMVNTRLVQLGEPFTLVLTAGARNGLVYLPGKDVNLSGCHIIRYREEDVSRKHEGYIAIQGVYELAAFTIPDAIIPRIPVRVLWTGGQTTEIESLPIRLKIRSMRPEEGLSLIDPRPPRRASRPWLLLAAGAMVALAGTGFGLRRLRTARTRKIRLVVPAHVKAYKALAELEKMEIQDTQQYFIEISKILRQYLAHRYHFPAMEQSRIKIVQHLERLEVEAKRRDMIDGLLAETDLVKFAMAPASLAQRQQALAITREIIELTREQPAKAPKQAS